MIDREALFQKGQRTVLPETLLANPGMDYQGIMYHREPRANILRKFRTHIGVFRCVLQDSPSYPNTTPQSLHPLFGFEYFNHSYWVTLKHQQLTNLLVAASEDHVLIAGENHILQIDSKTNSHVRLANYNSYSLDYDPTTELLCGTHNQSRLFVYDVRRRCELYLHDLGEVNLVNSVCFHREGSPTLVVSANQLQVDFIDLEKLVVARSIPSRAFVNYTAWWPGSRLYCMVMDDVDVEVTDDRTDTRRCMVLKGHLDYNFASAFLSEWVVATGGQDCSVRLWDLRMPTKETELFKGHEREVCSLRFNPRNDTLYSLEKIENVVAYRRSGGAWQTDSFDFIGFPKGMALTPCGDRLVLGIAERTLGGFLGLRIN